MNIKTNYRGYELSAGTEYGCYIKAPDGEMIFDTCALDEVAKTPSAAIIWMQGQVDFHILMEIASKGL